ncbi:SusD family protein [Pedobacter sp. ok626]|uniref:RagB/SusD family nutrient uptake outer membrane protein n=1 Tax=Pedobacter sp. ok626 TaxID=1761882 RepID=UPI0008875FF5|nr:RagB/SusD family nutrient uptake outer membrane protein [Pedobacter sp. ok626]SDL75127.1 SusD family protein [Pedobacter sp. ok626]
MKTRYFILTILGFLSLVLVTSCDKLVDTGSPERTLDPKAVYSDSVSVDAALVGLYSMMYNATAIGAPYGGGIGYLNALYADELVSTTSNSFESNSLLTSDANVSTLWSVSYAAIFRTNTVIEGLSESSNLSTAFKMKAMGEAKFLRAFSHFHLLNMFGHIPIIDTTDPTISALKKQSAPDEVYQFILNDLKEAVAGMSFNYPGGERIRVNKYAAIAMLAKVYLYLGDWQNAELQSAILLADKKTFQMVEPAKAFLTASTEAIWQFDSRAKGYASIATTFVTGANARPRYTIRDILYNAFETKDLRRSNWISMSAGYPYPGKYKSTKNNLEYDAVLRLGEMYLIHAEACVQQGKVQVAQDDLNVVRDRANATRLTTLDKDLLIAAVAKERQLELFTEWGNRFYDLKRRGKIDLVLSAVKPGVWKTDAALFPIPVVEMSKNGNLIQNKGYN